MPLLTTILLPPYEKADWKATLRFILRTVDLGFLFNDPLKLRPSQVKSLWNQK